MNKKLVFSFTLTTLLMLPIFVFALPDGVTILPLSGVTDALSRIEDFVFAIFLGLAVIMFIIAGYYFLTSDVTKGRSAVIYGVIGVGVAILSYSVASIVIGLLGGK